jgi:hypothetical protein
MTNRKKSLSQGWCDAVFESGPRRCVATQSKSTTRIPVLTPSGWQYAEGGHEATALMLLAYLQRFGVIKRFKSQPFALEEIGGPKKRIPDILVEVAFGEPTLHIIQVKSKRFITPEVQTKFDTESAFLSTKKIGYQVWTDADHLSRNTSHTVRMLDRGYRHPASSDVIGRIRNAASNVSTLEPLLTEFGWDDAISAASLGAFHINALEKIHEQSTINLSFPGPYYASLFSRRDAVIGWWDSI